MTIRKIELSFSEGEVLFQQYEEMFIEKIWYIFYLNLKHLTDGHTDASQNIKKCTRLNLEMIGKKYQSSNHKALNTTNSSLIYRFDPFEKKKIIYININTTYISKI